MRHLEARLVRHVHVRLVDFSLSGCRIVTDHPIDSGVEGELRVELDGKRYQDSIQIVRSTAHQGRSHRSQPPVTRGAATGHQGRSHRMTVGGTFAWANRRGTTSIRGTVPSTGRTLQRHSW